MNKLLVIESPNKIDTIKKYLNDSEFKIVATVGHIRDIPQTNMGFDEKTLEPRWIIPKKRKGEKESKEEIVRHIKQLASESDVIYLATDPDREGEAISWHVWSVLPEKDQKKCKRITFNEITKPAIIEALEHPRDLDELWVKSQFSRRLLDRLVGYKVSKMVRQKVKGQSAGRVQSVALKIIYDRERAIKYFTPHTWFTVDPEGKNKLTLVLRELSPALAKDKTIKYEKKDNEAEGSGINFIDEASANKVKDALSKKFKVYKIDDPVQFKRNPADPYKTSTLQQDGITRLGWNINKVTSIAQKLYEGINIDGESTALISYPRTDSIRLSDTFATKLTKFVNTKYGDKYLEVRKFTDKKEAKNVQGAHEAIRVIDPYVTPASIKNKIGKDEYALYNMVWCRTVASFMKPAVYERIIVRVINNDNKFYTYSRIIKFDGFRKVMNPTENISLRNIDTSDELLGTNLDIDKVTVRSHTTEPPARYNQASLVKELDNLGVGRPSTYRSMADMALERGYAILKSRAYVMTELGDRVIMFLTKYFPFLVSAHFTSMVEKELDDVADGKLEWTKPVRDMQQNLGVLLTNAQTRAKVVSDEVGRKCPKCGKPLVYRYNKKTHAKFIGCSGFPKCKYVEFADTDGVAMPSNITMAEKCPECGKPLVLRRNRRGQFFVGCSGYPKCKYIMKTDKEQMGKFLDKYLPKKKEEQKEAKSE